ncbi:SPFH domain-containing protein [Rheinheimera pleomorphica]|uniref:SPFH domain-containing protein n=1 Tax=Rheinheimera pleomorphica TaxID=2703963 RepID=UPI001F5068A0|nr:SPFH domain-containing protein [Rheinheimera pleomorphica]
MQLPPAITLLSKSLLGGLAAVLAVIFVLSRSVFYAEPGYVYHVRTILGAEHVVSDVGYQFFFFGRWNAWKRSLTVQAVTGGSDVMDYAEVENSEDSAALPPQNIMFLDQVDANAQATVRFLIPTDEVAFTRLAHEYRTPENLLRTALIPAFKETLQANASLMSAEEYYSGGRTEFNNEFENQMTNGIYVVRREEENLAQLRRQKGTANVALGTEQEDFGDETRVSFVVNKVRDSEGQPLRKRQKFVDYGITVVDARITQMNPNQRFVERMQLKQKASADRAIAREQRIQEEEQRLLAISRGEREVAERQAKAKVEQIQATTEADTQKQLAITEAEKLQAQANIQRETAKINLEKAEIEAQTLRTLAEAEAYQKKVILQADNALAQKLDAEIQIQRIWAESFAKRAVPQYVFGANGNTPTGSDSEARMFMQMLTMDAAKRLSYDRDLKK